MLGYETHLARRRPRRDRRPARSRSASSCASSAFSFAPASSSPTRPTNRQRAPSEAILRATLPAPPILVSLRCTAITARRRFRRNPRHLAIDEFVEHEVADAQHGLAGHRLATGRQNRTSGLIVCCMSIGLDGWSAKAIGAVEEIPDVAADRIFQRREAAIISGAQQPIDLALGEVLVAVANRCRACRYIRCSGGSRARHRPPASGP